MFADTTDMKTVLELQYKVAIGIIDLDIMRYKYEDDEQATSLMEGIQANLNGALGLLDDLKDIQ